MKILKFALSLCFKIIESTGEIESILGSGEKMMIMNQLYPLKFKPIIKQYMWGGTRLRDSLGKKIPGAPAAESWEISGVQGNISVVSEGFLKGNNLQELIEVYMGDLVGDKIYERFGMEFPLLIKFIDANQNLSIQVHPDDETARIKHKAYGKTEMWYVIDAEKDASLISGLKRSSDREELKKLLSEGGITEILNSVKVKPGDTYFIPAGRIHAIGKGILITEIQQTSDITYRVYDWDRRDADGKPRPLHTELALDVMDYRAVKQIASDYSPRLNEPVKLVQCPYFTTRRIDFDKTLEQDYNQLDSFIIYICFEGRFKLRYSEDAEPLTIMKGETVLVPAEIKAFEMIPEEPSSCLEVFIS